MYIIKSDEYTMISTYVYFGNQNFLSSLWLHDNIIVITLLELRNSNRHKHSFKVYTTYQTTITMINIL